MSILSTDKKYETLKVHYDIAVVRIWSRVIVASGHNTM